MTRTFLAPLLGLLAATALSTHPVLTRNALRAQDSIRTGDSTDTLKKPAPSLDSVIVFVTRTGAKYHLIDCSSLKSSAIPMLLIDARRRYGPCGRCHPPR